jgi:hypothetical protein
MEEIWKQLPNELAFRIIDYMDAGTRREFGLKPRKLPPSELTIRRAIEYAPFYTSPFNRVNISENCNVIADEDGEISWRFGPENCFRVWKYHRDGKPLQVLEFKNGTVNELVC